MLNKFIIQYSTDYNLKDIQNSICDNSKFIFYADVYLGECILETDMTTSEVCSMPFVTKIVKEYI